MHGSQHDVLWSKYFSLRHITLASSFLALLVYTHALQFCIWFNAVCMTLSYCVSSTADQEPQCSCTSRQSTSIGADLTTGWLKKVSCWHSTTAYFFEPPCISTIQCLYMSLAFRGGLGLFVRRRHSASTSTILSPCQSESPYTELHQIQYGKELYDIGQSSLFNISGLYFRSCFSCRRVAQRAIAIENWDQVLHFLTLYKN